MHIFIINPTAGKGQGQKVVEEFLTSHPQLKKRCKTFHTKYTGHATSLAEQIAAMHHERVKQLIVVGGDGTFYEVLNGLKDYPKSHWLLCLLDLVMILLEAGKHR